MVENGSKPKTLASFPRIYENECSVHFLYDLVPGKSSAGPWGEVSNNIW